MPLSPRPATHPLKVWGIHAVFGAMACDGQSRPPAILGVSRPCSGSSIIRTGCRPRRARARDHEPRVAICHLCFLVIEPHHHPSLLTRSRRNSSDAFDLGSRAFSFAPSGSPRTLCGGRRSQKRVRLLRVEPRWEMMSAGDDGIEDRRCCRRLSVPDAEQEVGVIAGAVEVPVQAPSSKPGRADREHDVGNPSGRPARIGRASAPRICDAEAAARRRPATTLPGSLNGQTSSFRPSRLPDRRAGGRRGRRQIGQPERVQRITSRPPSELSAAISHTSKSARSDRCKLLTNTMGRFVNQRVLGNVH